MLNSDQNHFNYECFQFNIYVGLCSQNFLYRYIDMVCSLASPIGRTGGLRDASCVASVSILTCK